MARALSGQSTSFVRTIARGAEWLRRPSSSRPTPASRIDGFDWADAGIGAAGAIGIALLLMGFSALVLRRQRVTALT